MGRLPALLVLAAMIAACGSAQPSTSPTSSASPGEACALTTEPGPADEPPRGGEELIDTADWSGGRWRLCLAGPLAGTAEDTMWCTWTRDRSAVLELNPRPLRIGSLDYETYVSIQRNQFEFHAMDLSGSIANYEPAGAMPAGESPDQGRSGTLNFEVSLLDPEHGAGLALAPRMVGVMRWRCGDPPPPR